MAAKKKAKTFDLSVLGAVLDRASFEALESRYPAIAAEIEDAIESGARVRDVRRYAIERQLPPEWVAWLESAARAVTLE